MLPTSGNCNVWKKPNNEPIFFPKAFLVNNNVPPFLVYTLDILPKDIPAPKAIKILIKRMTGKMSRVYTKNGGTLLFTRKAFGKKMGSLFGFFQTLQLPLVGSTVALAIVWAFRNIQGPNGGDLSTQWYIYLIAFVIYFLCSMVPFFGFTSSNISLYILWFLKWLIIIASIVLAFCEIKNFGHNIGQGSTIKLSGFNYFDLIAALMTFFFAFGGFEVVASMSGDLKNSKKSMISTILMIILFIGIFYFFYYYAIMGALGPKGVAPTSKTSEPNPINNIFEKVLGIKPSFNDVKIGSIAVAVLLVITQISNKSGSRLQGVWGNTRIISSYSENGYLPDVFTRKNKYNQYMNALYFDLILCTFFTVLYLILNFFLKFLASGALQAVSYISFMQYLGVASACLYMGYKKDSKIKNKKWENVYFIFVIIAIIFILISYMVGGIYDFVNYLNKTPGYRDPDKLTVILTDGIIFLFFDIWYMLSLFQKKWHLKIETKVQIENPKMAAKII